MTTFNYGNANKKLALRNERLGYIRVKKPVRRPREARVISYDEALARLLARGSEVVTRQRPLT